MRLAATRGGSAVALHTTDWPARLASSSSEVAGSNGQATGRLPEAVAAQPRRLLGDPAAEPQSLLERLQDTLRPRVTRGRGYRWAEGSARAALQEQQASSKGLPGVESMYAPAEAVGDEVTAPRSWHFSNRSDQLDERRQEELAEQKRRGASG